MGRVSPTPPTLRDLLRDDATTRHLLANAGLLHRLEGLVGLYAPGGQWWEFRMASLGIAHGRRVTKGRTIRGTSARQKARALLHAVRRVERLVMDPEMAALLTYGGIAMRPELKGLPETLHALRVEAEGLLAVQPARRPGRGRPVDRWRAVFCRGVTSALLDFGEDVQKTRNGVYARVLAHAFTAAREDPPEDLFPLVRRAVDAVRSSALKVR